MNIHRVGTELFHADRQTDMHDASNTCFYFVIFATTAKAAYFLSNVKENLMWWFINVILLV
jgi:hypothetical protein